jgi:hypothetical protein
VATTTNFGWTTPDNTGYVKDGALAIRTLGNSIDTTLVDLKGGTTDQVLKKASGTDMDFVWGTAGALVYITQSSFTTSSAVNVNNCFTSTYRNYKLVLDIDSASTSASAMYLKMRASSTDSSASYYWGSFEPNSNDNTLYYNRGNNISNGFGLGYQGLGGFDSSIDVYNPQLAQATRLTSLFTTNIASDVAVSGFASGSHAVSTSYDGFSIIPGSGTITGIVRVYGYVNS